MSYIFKKQRTIGNNILFLDNITYHYSIYHSLRYGFEIWKKKTQLLNV